jgi:sugar lactone lactonase YvrE
MVTSLCFGGRDRRDMFIVTADNRDDQERGGTVFRTRAAVAGCPIPLATI